MNIKRKPVIIFNKQVEEVCTKEDADAAAKFLNTTRQMIYHGIRSGKLINDHYLSYEGLPRVRYETQ